MSKAMLILDMPESCVMCDFADYEGGRDKVLYCTYLPIDDCVCPYTGRHSDCPLKPVEDNDYTALAQLAYDMVLTTMQGGEQKHGKDGWKDQAIPCHLYHMAIHALHAKYEDTYEDHIAHALTRCAMIRWLENDKR